MFQKLIGAFKFKTQYEYDFYLNTFKNPLKDNLISAGDIFYVNDCMKVANDIQVNPVFFQVVGCSTLDSFIMFFQVDCHYHSFGQSVSEYRSHDVFWFPVRDRRVSTKLFFCNIDLFRKNMKLFSFKDLPSTFLMTDYESFKHDDDYPSLDFIFDYAQKNIL